LGWNERNAKMINRTGVAAWYSTLPGTESGEEESGEKRGERTGDTSFFLRIFSFETGSE
jgi:hypothetical protein